MKKRDRAGFAFTVVDGDRRTSDWLVYPSDGKDRSDFYLSCRDVGGTYKISFHQSGNWHVAYTSEFWNANEGPGKPRTRFLQQWERPPEHYPGLTLAYRVALPHGSANIPVTTSVDDRLLVALDPAPPGMAVNVGIVIANSQARVDSNASEFLSGAIGSFDLPNGDMVAARWAIVPYVPPNPIDLEGGWLARTSRPVAPQGLVRSLLFNSDEGGHFAVDVVPNPEAAMRMLEIDAEMAKA